jgi:hypothetical protein
MYHWRHVPLEKKETSLVEEKVPERSGSYSYSTKTCEVNYLMNFGGLELTSHNLDSFKVGEHFHFFPEIVEVVSYKKKKLYYAYAFSTAWLALTHVHIYCRKQGELEVYLNLVIRDSYDTIVLKNLKFLKKAHFTLTKEELKVNSIQNFAPEFLDIHLGLCDFLDEKRTGEMLYRKYVLDSLFHRVLKGELDIEYFRKYTDGIDNRVHLLDEIFLSPVLVKNYTRKFATGYRSVRLRLVESTPNSLRQIKENEVL